MLRSKKSEQAPVSLLSKSGKEYSEPGNLVLLNLEHILPAFNTVLLKCFLKVLNDIANANLGELKILKQILVKTQFVLQACT